MKSMDKIHITIVSDLNNFKKNMYSIISLLPLKGVLSSTIDSIYEIKSILDEKRTNVIIINKTVYTKEEMDYLLALDYKEVSVVMIIDAYFKYEPFYLNCDKGFITIRRPISINKFLEVLKIALYGSIKKKKTLDYEKIRALEFAKTILVVYEKMFEDEAHKYVEMMAMNQRVSLYDACLELIVKYLLEKENIVYEHKIKF